MKRRIVCSSAYFYGDYLVIKKSESSLWEAFACNESAPRVAASHDRDEIDAKLRSLTPSHSV